MAADKIIRVVVEIQPREIGIYMLATATPAAGISGKVIEEERFGLEKSAPDIAPMPVARDVFNLLYQCALDSVAEG